MSLLDAFWHLLNFFAPALGVALIAAGGAKLLWRRELSAVPWLRLAGRTAMAAALASVVALLVLGHDGRMLGYGAMVAAAALALWWTGFAPRR